MVMHTVKRVIVLGGLAQLCRYESTTDRLPQPSRGSKAGHHRRPSQEAFLALSSALWGSFTRTGPASA